MKMETTTTKATSRSERGGNGNGGGSPGPGDGRSGSTSPPPGLTLVRTSSSGSGSEGNSSGSPRQEVLSGGAPPNLWLGPPPPPPPPPPRGPSSATARSFWRTPSTTMTKSRRRRSGAGDYHGHSDGCGGDGDGSIGMPRRRVSTSIFRRSSAAEEEVTSASTTFGRCVVPRGSVVGCDGGAAAARAMSSLRNDDGTFVVSPAWRKGRRAENLGGGQSGGRSRSTGFASRWAAEAAAACLLSAAALAALAAWSSLGASSDSGSSAPPSSSSSASASSPELPPFEFRPPPVPGTESERAASLLFREAYGTLRSDGSLGADDPLNPGSIFIVADLREEGEGRISSILDDEGMKEFALGLEGYLETHIRSLFRESGASAATLSGIKAKEGNDNDQTVVEVISYYSMSEWNLERAGRARYAAPDGRSTLVEVKFAVPPNLVRDGISKGGDLDGDTNNNDNAADDDLDGPLHSYLSAVVEHVRRYGKSRGPPNVDLTYAGLPLIRLDLASSSPSAASFGPLDEMLPPHSPSIVAYRHLVERFGLGVIAPYRVVFRTRNQDDTIFADSAFRTMQKVMGELSQVGASADDEDGARGEDGAGGIAAVNLDSIPQRIEDGEPMEGHLDEVMDELYGLKSGSPNAGGSGDGASVTVARPEEEGAAHKIPSTEQGRLRGRQASNQIEPRAQEALNKRVTYDGLAYLRSNSVPFPLFVGAELCAKTHSGKCPVELLQLLVDAASSYSSGDGRATYVTATLGADPFSEEGVMWLEDARAKLMEIEGRQDGLLRDLEVFIVGGASLEYDASKALEQAVRAHLQESGAAEEAADAPKGAKGVPSVWVWICAVLLFAGLTFALSSAIASRRTSAPRLGQGSYSRSRQSVDHYNKLM